MPICWLYLCHSNIYVLVISSVAWVIQMVVTQWLRWPLKLHQILWSRPFNNTFRTFDERFNILTLQAQMLSSQWLCLIGYYNNPLNIRPPLPKLLLVDCTLTHIRPNHPYLTKMSSTETLLTYTTPLINMMRRVQIFNGSFKILLPFFSLILQPSTRTRPFSCWFMMKR